MLSAQWFVKKKKKIKLNIHKESEESVRKRYKKWHKSSKRQVNSIWIVSHVQHKLSYIEQLTMEPVRLSINNKLYL